MRSHAKHVHQQTNLKQSIFSVLQISQVRNSQSPIIHGAQVTRFDSIDHISTQTTEKVYDDLIDPWWRSRQLTGINLQLFKARKQSMNPGFGKHVIYIYTYTSIIVMVIQQETQKTSLNFLFVGDVQKHHQNGCISRSLNGGAISSLFRQGHEVR